tara:strand:- start:330 stop:668 length:339 start_codon:yes stop_codon:yes gene_type:complete
MRCNSALQVNQVGIKKNRKVGMGSTREYDSVSPLDSATLNSGAISPTWLPICLEEKGCWAVLWISSGTLAESTTSISDVFESDVAHPTTTKTSKNAKTRITIRLVSKFISQV